MSLAEEAPDRDAMAKRILVADDSEVIRRQVRTILEPDADLEICAEATTGLEAVQEVQRSSRVSRGLNRRVILPEFTPKPLFGLPLPCQSFHITRKEHMCTHEGTEVRCAASSKKSGQKSGSFSISARCCSMSVVGMRPSNLVKATRCLVSIAQLVGTWQNV